MKNDILFCIVILAANIIQAITGFAGTVLAMPFSMMLVGYPVARPILNALGIIAGIMVVVKERKNIKYRELLKILGFMLIGFVGGILLKPHLMQLSKELYIGLGVVIIILAASGIFHEYSKKELPPMKIVPAVFMLVSAGFVHGVFVCGGPLVVSYLSRQLHDKDSFRATLSCVWIVLNFIMLFDDVRTGDFTMSMLPLFAVTVAVIVAATVIGQILSKKFSREAFMKLSYALMIVSGVSLFFK